MVGESKSMTKNPPLNHITIILHSLSQIVTSQIVTSQIRIETQLNNLKNAASINKKCITNKHNIQACPWQTPLPLRLGRHPSLWAWA